MSKTKVKVVNNYPSSNSFFWGIIIGIILAAIIAVVLKKKKGIDVATLLSDSFSPLFPCCSQVIKK